MAQGFLKNKRTPNSSRPKGARNHIARANKVRKRKEAETRNAAYKRLTPEQQLAALDQDEHVAARQRARILKRIEERGRDNNPA